MQINLDEEKQKIKNEIKKFFDENEIKYQEDEKHLMVRGELTYVVFLKITIMSIKIKEDKCLEIIFGKKKIILRYEDSFKDKDTRMIKIPKKMVSAIYYTDKTLVILF